MSNIQIKTKRFQSGVYAIEFVLVAGFLFFLLFSIVELGKILYFFDASSESTRLAARIGTVCSQNNTAIKAAITNRLPFVTNDNISISYLPTDCTADNCKTITVSLNQAIYESDLLGFNVAIPNFQTTLPRESMDNQYNSNCS